jgi:hypothetical protein
VPAILPTKPSRQCEGRFRSDLAGAMHRSKMDFYPLTSSAAVALARNVNSKPPGFDDQLEFGRLLDRKVPASSLQYFIYLRSSAAAGVNDARSIRHQAPPMSLSSRSQSMHTHCVRCMPIA